MKNVNKPFKIKIHGLTWTVELKLRSSTVLDGAFGLCSAQELKIILATDVPDELFASTFFHEAVHACMFTFNQVMDRNEEHYADSVGLGVAQIVAQLHTLPVDVRKRLKCQ